MKKIVIILFFLFVSIANATVSVESFTCNGMSGTVVVENGDTFSCQATIKNEDTQNSANIGSVSLLVSGSWAEATSYSGTSFSSTLGASASTTATFSSIKGVTPGATNKFQAILIDSSSDTFVTDTNVNVVTIKTLSVSTSASSVEEGSEFDVSATFIAGGDLGSASFTWSGTGGCTVSSGHTATKDVGALSHNAEVSRSWTILQGASDCVNTITASGTSSSVTVTKSKSATVTEPNADSSSSGSSTTTSGGGSGGGGGSTAQTRTIKEIKSGESSTVTFTKAINSIFIEALKDVKNVVISVEETTSPGVPSIQNAYKYIKIYTTNISDGDIKSAVIAFSVNKTWLSGKDKNLVRLNRYNNGWSELNTEILSEDASFIRYSAKTPGFSIFAIAIKSAEPSPAGPSGEPTATEPGSESGNTTPTETGGTAETGAGATGGVSESQNTVILIIVLAIIGAVGWFYFHGHKRKYRYDYHAEKKWHHKN